MNEFWLWFIRPFAEVLGALAMVIVFVAVAVLYLYINAWRASRNAKRAAQPNDTKGSAP